VGLFNPDPAVIDDFGLATDFGDFVYLGEAAGGFDAVVEILFV
jgi:hypothetical protein